MSSNYSCEIINSLSNYAVIHADWFNKSVNSIQSYLSSVINIPHCNRSCSHMNFTNHLYFQFANIFFLLSYFGSSEKFGLIYFRCMLLIGCIFFAIWGTIILCAFDILIWNVLFIVCNLIHVFVLLFRQWPINFTEEIENLYSKVFEPVGVSRKQFLKLLKCTKTSKNLKCQEIFAQENITRVEFLSVVLSGKLTISQQGKLLHTVFPYQFLDSPEWFSVSTDDFFQVSITATEESKILLWHRDKLRLSIIGDKFLQTILDHILSKDIVNKLILINETTSMCTNGHLLANSYTEDISPDNKSLMIVRRTTNGAGITDLISRQLQGDNSNELVPLLNRGAYFQSDDRFPK